VIGTAAVHDHVARLRTALDALESNAGLLDRWACHLGSVLPGGHRLLVAGNGGSAALAVHLTAELTGRYQHDRPAFSAIALVADPASVTAIGNDYGFEQVFARQVDAHARAGDVVLLLSTSGRSPNLLAAARAATSRRATCWALTGAAPNPLSVMVDEALTVEGDTPTVQEVHQVAVHLLCELFDREVVL